MSDLVETVAKAIYAQWPNTYKTYEPTTLTDQPFVSVWKSETWDEMCSNTPSRKMEVVDAARAALTAIEAAGFVIVPREATSEMLAACADQEDRAIENWSNLTLVDKYKVMLAAAPKVTG